VMNTKRDRKVKWLSKNHVLDLKVGSWLAGEFPRPSYVAGQVEGSIRFLRRDRNFNFRFHSGTRCNGGQVDTGATVVQQDALDKIDNELISYINPPVNDNFRVTDPLYIKYAMIPGEVFDVPEQQADGSVQIRTFKLSVHHFLEKYENGSAREIPINVEKNNMGEFVITAKPQGDPIVIDYDDMTNPNSADDIGVSNMAPSIGAGTSYTNTNATSSTVSTVYPVPQNTSSYQVPQTASFGNGTPAAGNYTGQVPNVGSGYGGNGPSVNDNVPEQMPVLTPDLSGNSANPVNALKYDTRYLLQVIAMLKEYKNGTWQEVYRSHVTKDFHTEKEPGQSSHPSKN